MSLHYMTPERLALPNHDQLFTEFTQFMLESHADQNLSTEQLQKLFNMQMAEAYKNVGNAFLTRKPKEPRKSIQLYECAISLRDTPAYHTNLAAAYSEVGEHDKCIAACKRALEIDPKFTKAHTRMARQYSKNGQYKESAEEFEKVLEIDPSDAQARKGLEKVREILSAQK